MAAVCVQAIWTASAASISSLGAAASTIASAAFMARSEIPPQGERDAACIWNNEAFTKSLDVVPRALSSRRHLFSSSPAGGWTFATLASVRHTLTRTGGRRPWPAAVVRVLARQYSAVATMTGDYIPCKLSRLRRERFKAALRMIAKAKPKAQPKRRYSIDEDRMHFVRECVRTLLRAEIKSTQASSADSVAWRSLGTRHSQIHPRSRRKRRHYPRHNHTEREAAIVRRHDLRPCNGHRGSPLRPEPRLRAPAVHRLAPLSDLPIGVWMGSSRCRERSAIFSRRRAAEATS